MDAPAIHSDESARMDRAEAILLQTVLGLDLDGAAIMTLCAGLIALILSSLTAEVREAVLAKLMERIRVHPSIVPICPGPAGLWPCSHPDGLGHGGDHQPKKEEKPNA